MKKLLWVICCLAFVLVSCASGGSDDEEVAVQPSGLYSKENLDLTFETLTNWLLQLSDRVAFLEACVEDMTNQLSMFNPSTGTEFKQGRGHAHRFDLMLYRC